MKQLFNAAAFLALSLSIFVTQNLFAQNKSQPVQRWEYYKVSTCQETDLNKLGDEGWDIIAATEVQGSCTTYTFKRLKPANALKYVDPQMEPPKPAESPACKLTATQAPTIRGLRLGMTVDDLLALFPGANPNELKARIELVKGYPAFGQLTHRFLGAHHKDRLDQFSFTVALFDGRVRSFNIYYPFSNSSQYGRVYSKDQLIDKLVKSLGIPTNEKWRDQSNAWLYLDCLGFSIKVEYQDTINISVKDNSKEIEGQIKERQMTDAEKKRGGFEP